MNAPLDELLEFLRFPSISTEKAHADHVFECGSWLSLKLREFGLRSELRETAGHPIVLARNVHQPGRPTIMIYGHYDVQPVDPLELWRTPPFEPVVADGIITARGATDNKGQIMAHIQGVRATLERAGDLPVNLIFLIEGEEEIGSPHLETFLAAHRDELACDLVAISDTGMVAPGVPTLTYGLRGVAALELKVTGPSSDLHSGIFGGAVANPITALARILSTLHDASGKVAAPGFYEGVEEIEPWEREAWAALPLGDAELLAVTGAPELAGEAGYTALERTWARPTAELNGIGGGYQGPGTKTVIPSEAFAKITCRLVPGQRPDHVMEKLRDHLQAQCPRGVRLEMKGGHAGLPYLTDPHSSAGKAAQRALERTFGKPTALIREGGSIPIVQAFKDVLGAETLLLGLALPDCHAHAPNETFPVENFEAGMRLNQALLEELAVG